MTPLRWLKRAAAEPPQHGVSHEFPPVVVLQGERQVTTESLGQTNVLAEVLLKGGNSPRIKAGADLDDLVILIKAIEQC